MDFTTYVRKPFTVEVVEITAENLEEVAKLVGEVRKRDDGTPFIYVDRKIVPNVFGVDIGYFLTKMGRKYRCYSPKVFAEEFMLQDEAIKPFMDYISSGGQPPEQIS